MDYDRWVEINNVSVAEADIRAQFADESEMRERANFLAAEGSRYGLTADEQTELNALCAWLGDDQ